MVLTLGGTEAGGVVKFLMDSFGSTTEFDQLKMEALHNEPEEGEEPEDSELVPPSSARESVLSGPKVDDLCHLEDAKPAFPTSFNSLSTTSVPPEFVSDNLPSGPGKQSTYYCLFGGCNVSTLQKASLCSHIQRKHLGVAIQCRFCGQAWWTSNPFLPHMKAKHPKMSAVDFYITPSQVEALKAKAEAAAKAELEVSTSLTSTSTS